MRKLVRFVITHAIALGIGFALGIYLLPILTAPPGPDAAMLEEKAQEAIYSVELTRDLRGNDFVHWGEGTFSVTPTQIIHEGKLAPGPDYKLYLVPEFVEHEDEFEPIKASAIQLGDVKTFDGLILDIPEGVDIEAYNTILIWCEAFGEFITAAQYR